MKIGDRVKYTGKSGNGLPFSGEIGIVTDVNQSAGLVRVKLKDGAQIQLTTDKFKSAPIAVPIIGYSILATVAIISVLRSISR